MGKQIITKFDMVTPAETFVHTQVFRMVEVRIRETNALKDRRLEQMLQGDQGNVKWVQVPRVVEYR